MTLVGNDLYVADTDRLIRFPYNEGDTQIKAQPTKVVDLPGGTLNHHWTKNVIASQDGSKLRSEEHTSELQSLMRISYAVCCLKKKNKKTTTHQRHNTRRKK